MSDKQFIQQAISLATENVKVGGRPFGAVIVKNGQVIAHAVNQITATNDPTAHAELLALREAGKIMTTTSHNLPNAAGILFNTLISQYKPPKAKNVAPLAISLLNDE